MQEPMSAGRQLGRRDFLIRLGMAGLALFLAACRRVLPGAAATPGQATPALPPSPSPIPSTATPTPTPSSTPRPFPTPPAPSPEVFTPPPSPSVVRPARVAFVKTADRADGVRRAPALLGKPPVGGKSVLLKPNLNSADPAPGSTHNDVLRTLMETLWEWGLVPSLWPTAAEWGIHAG